MCALPFSNVTAERLFSTLKDLKTDKRNCVAIISVACNGAKTKTGMKRLNLSSSSLVLDLEMTKLLSNVKASATAEEAATLISGSVAP